MTYSYKILEDGSMVPYPIDTQLPQISRETILHFDEKFVIFKIPYIENHDKSIFCIFQRCQHGIKYAYELCRWDNVGGWRVIYGERYTDTNEAMAYLIPMAKYFV